MGSYCALTFDDLDVINAKSTVPDVFISLFQEADRRVDRTDDPDDPECRVAYVVERYIMLQRLDVLGVTAEAARAAYEKWKAAQLDMYREHAEDGSEWAVVALAALESLTYVAWSARVPEILKIQFTLDRGDARDEVERNMLERDDGWLLFEAVDVRLSVRALLDACSDARQVILDISDLIGGGYLEDNVWLCDEARKPGAIARPLLEPTVILGEGGSDIRILRQSLQALFPYLTDYFGFFEHDELRVDGGVGYLIKFLQAFAAARISSRMVALFDNDTAGREAFDRASALPLPSNIKVLRLPDIPLAKAYPSIGPQGEHPVDVNGKAAGIELYLGKRNLLSADGKLVPVRWRGYSDKMDAYQGEVEGKADVLKRFERDLRVERTPDEAQAAFPELAAVWRMIFDALRE